MLRPAKLSNIRVEEKRRGLGYKTWPCAAPTRRKKRFWVRSMNS